MTEILNQIKIKGRVVALGETVVTFILLILGLLGVGDIREAWKWENMGATYTTIFLGSVGVWMTAKAATTIGDVVAKTKEKIAAIKNGGTYVEKG